MSELKRTLGLPLLVFYGTGVILGAGVYSIIGKAAGSAGDTLWISFLFASVSAALTALSYAELSALFPKAGGEYVYLSNTFHKNRWMGSAVGIAVAFSSAATAATVAIAFSGYLGQFFEAPPIIVSMALLVLFSGLSIMGIRESAWANVVFTLVEVGGLGLIVILGLRSNTFGEVLSAPPHWGTLSGAALLIFSFFGFESIVNLSEEAKDPKRDIPRAIFISLGISSAFYILVALAAIALVTPDRLASSDAPLMLVAQTVSSRFGTILGIVALFSTANTALISMIGASRILFSMARAHALPQLVGRVLPSRKTPWIASLIVLTFALALLPLGKIEVVASISALATMIAFFGVNAALITLRVSKPSMPRPFRVPLSIGKVPVLPVLGAASSLALLTQFNRVVYLVGGTFMVAVVLIFKWSERKKAPRTR